MQSEQQQRIMGYFIEEAKDHLNTIEQGLLNLQSTIEDSEMVNEVFRAAHSVKGGAAMLGLSSIQRTSHRLEDCFKVLRECPIRIDQKLESLFLRVFDTLQELLDQLQGPFGLTEDKADEIMADVEPVFTELHGHLATLVEQSGATPPDDVNLGVAAAPVAARPATDVELRQSFQSEVPVQLREMLQLFKQAESDDNRLKLQEHCRTLARLGKQFGLDAWCDLLSLAELAIACPENSFKTLAPILIRDIKGAQDLVLAGKATEVRHSEALEQLISAFEEDEDLTPEAALDELFASSDAAIAVDDASLFLDEEPHLDMGDLDLPAEDISFETGDEDGNHWFDASEAPIGETAAQNVASGDDSGLDDLLSMGAEDDNAAWQGDRSQDFDLFHDQALGTESAAESFGATAEPVGPEVGAAELNSLADLFGDQTADLGLPWDDDAAFEDPDELLDALDLETSDDFSDLLFEQPLPSSSSSTDTDDISGFFNLNSPVENAAQEGAIASSTGNGVADTGDILSPEQGLDELFDALSDDGIDIGESALPAEETSFDALFDGDALSDVEGHEAFHDNGLDLTASTEFHENEDVPGVEGAIAPEADESAEDEVTQSVEMDALPSTDSNLDFAADSTNGLFEETNDVTTDVWDVEDFRAESAGLDSEEVTATERAAGEPTEAAEDVERVDAIESLTDLMVDSLETAPLTTDDVVSTSNELDFNFDQLFEAQDASSDNAIAFDAEDTTSSDERLDFSDLPGFEDVAISADAIALDSDLDFGMTFEDAVETGSAESDDLLGDLFGESVASDSEFSSNEQGSSAGLDDFGFIDALDESETSVSLPIEHEITTDAFVPESDEQPSHLHLDSIGDEIEPTTDTSEGLLDSSEDDSELDAIAIDADFTFESDAALFAESDEALTDAEAGVADFDTDFALTEAIEAESDEALTDAEASFTDFDDDFALTETIEDESEHSAESLFLTDSADNLLDTQPENEQDVDDFADLEALLGDDVAMPAPSELASPPQDDFADLEALIGSEPSAASEPASTLESVNVSDEFDDLEKLLEDAEQTLGGSPTSKARRGGAPAPRRQARARPTRAQADQNMRVSVKNLDNLNNLIGELVVNRNSLEQTQERLRQFLDNLLYQVQQLSDVGQRMRDLYERSLLESSLLSSRRNYNISGFGMSGGNGSTQSEASHATGASFDALEMDRFTGFHTLSQEMIELIVRVRESASDIDFVVEESDQVTRTFRQVTTQLQEGLNRARMVPFAQTADRLPRAVRDISLRCGKQAELVVEGRDTLIDKMILEQLYDPMTHLVNNAITHGIETPEERQSAGKPATGKIVVRSFHQGNQTVISITDDGAGIDPERVKRKALEKGLITPQDAQEMSRHDVYDLLFHSGFSTRDQADDFAGRGVGMDVVRTNLNEIRGTITTDSNIGSGTTFTIRLPLTLSISKALSCISNRARIAFPMDGVEDMLDVPRERIQTDEEGRPCILWRDLLLPFQPLHDLLAHNRVMGRSSVYGGQEEDIVSIVVLRSATNFLALQVDQVLGEQEIVIKQLEGPVPKPVGIAGATVLGDGRIMPIADVLELIDLSLGRIRRDGGSSLWAKDQVTEHDDSEHHEPTVLIVDDSITVRELLSMTFNKVGYRVEQARDGQEAWEKLRSGLPCDLVFCDIEMPRMDGLELLSRLQKDPALATIPIAMLTSRGADRHRQMAVSLGAKGYFTKPYLEEVLLDAAQRMLKGEVLVASK